MRYSDIIHAARLLEMAQEIPATEFNLDNPIVNFNFLTKQLLKVTEVIEETLLYTIVRTGDFNNGWIFLHNIQDNTVDYAVQCKVRTWSWLPKTVTQTIIWRDDASELAQGIAVKMFFEVLLKKFNSIISDSQQTPDGNRFWRSRLANAVSRGMRVARVDTNQHIVDWYDPSGPGDFRTWLNSFEVFGKKHKHQGLRYLIQHP